MTEQLYSVHPGVKMVQKWVAELRAKTGNSLEDWLNLLNTEGPAEEKGRRAWLKENYGLGANSAWWLAERSMGKGVWDDTPENYLATAVKNVDAQLKPTTLTRLDLSLALRDTDAPPRLIDTGGFAKKDRLSHRFAISKPEEIDDEVRHWFRVAYEMNP